MTTPIQLIIGLGNPGKEYHSTRHNAGVWFIEKICKDHQITLSEKNKFHAQIAQVKMDHHDIKLAVPTTFMNHSGLSVLAICQYYQLNPNNILVAHDDLDLPVGTIRLKYSGGHGGHNGLRDIISHLNTQDFHRLRIGISHPGQSKAVVNYVLKSPSQKDFDLIQQEILKAQEIVPLLLQGKIQQATQKLHTPI